MEAYRRVGVEPPEDFFSKTWREWLNDPKLHKRKNEEYLGLVGHMVRPTQLVKLFKLTGGIIITGASQVAATAVIDAINISPTSTFCELTTQGKARVLNALGPGIVFEDSVSVANYLKENTKWKVCLAL